MGIGPLIAWRRTSFRALARDARVADRRRGRRRRSRSSLPAPARRSPGLIAYTFSAFVLATIVRRARARHARDRLAVRARLAQPAPLRRLHRPRRDRAARDRHRRLERVRQLDRATPRRSARAMTVDGYTLTHCAACVSRRRRTRPRRARSSTCSGRWNGTISVRRQPVPATRPSRRSEVGIKTDWLRGGGPLRDRRRRQPEDAGRLRQGAREAARQPDLDRRDRVPARLARSRCGPTRASSGGSSTRLAPARA